MPLLVVKLILTHPKKRSESVWAEQKSSQYDPDHLDALVNVCLSQALGEKKYKNLSTLKSWQPEISIVLTAEDEESIRPSMHLNPDTLLRLAKAGAAVDFDPYV
jgi:hypothetical protein